MCRGMIFSGKKVGIIFGKSIVLGHQLGRKEGRVQNIKNSTCWVMYFSLQINSFQIIFLGTLLSGIFKHHSSKSHPSGQYELLCLAVLPAAFPSSSHCLPYQLRVFTWHGSWKMGLGVRVLTSEPWVGYLMFLSLFLIFKMGLTKIK